MTGSLELSGEGKAMKYYELAPFELRVTAATIVDALGRDKHGSNDAKAGGGDRHTGDIEGGR